jgi:hypothetical protein
MRQIGLSLAIAGLLGLGGSASGQVQVLTFDDLPGSEERIPNGYGGFEWSNLWYLDAVNYWLNPSGYQAGMVSANNVAFNGYGNPASMMIQGPGEFHFIGTYLTAAWNTGLNIEIIGTLGGTPVDSRTVTVDRLAPTWFEFNWDVDAISFRSYGGTPYPQSGQQFAMDNFTFVPEPAMMALLGAGIPVLLKCRRRA